MGAKDGGDGDVKHSVPGAEVGDSEIVVAVGIAEVIGILVGFEDFSDVRKRLVELLS